MQIKTIKTRILVPPKDDLLKVIKKSIKKLPEKSIVVIASKVVSIWEGRCVEKENYKDKDDLIIQEADMYLPRAFIPGAWVMHTLKNNLFIPSAGVDESNANGYYILWPKNIKGTTKEIWTWLRKKYKVKNVGVIITDSHTNPLRRGVLGISLAHYGFNPLRDYRKKPDLFGRLLRMSQTNIADGLAVAAVVMMGERNESTPIAIITDIPWVQFVQKPVKSRKPYSSFEIKTSEDMYYPLFSSVPWKKGRKRKKKG